MSKLQVIEPMHSGHHTNYLLALVPGIDRLKQAGTIDKAIFTVTPRHYEILVESGEVERVGKTIEWDATLVATPPDPKMPDRRALYESLQSVVETHRADALLCTTADYDLIPHALRNLIPAKRFWPKNSAGIIHFGFPKGGLSKKEDCKRVAYETSWKFSRWKHLLMVNPLIYEGYLKRSKNQDERYSLLPDPVPEFKRIDRNEARDGLGLARDGIYIGCVGMMDRRKAVPELLQAFFAAGFDPRVRLVLAGRIDAEYRRLIDLEYADQVASGRIVLIDRDLSDLEVAWGYAALDLHSVLQYRRFNLSANVLKCVASGRPFVCDRTGFAAMVAGRFDAGLACDVGDTDSIARALVAGIRRAEVPREALGAGRLREFHSYQNFARSALARVIGPEVYKILGTPTNWAHAYGILGPVNEVSEHAHHLGGLPAQIPH